MQRKISLGKPARLLAALMVVLATVLPATAVAAPPAAPPTAPAAAPLAQPEAGTYTGTVFRDYNASGAQNTDQLVAPFLKEPTIAGVIVTAYDSNNAVQGTTTTVRCTAAGAPAAYCTGEDLGPNYSLTASGTGPYRIEFTLPGDGSLDYLKPGAAGATTVQFVANGGASNVNVGFNNPTDYSQANPRLVTPRTSYGPRLPVTAGPLSAQEIGLPTFSVGAAPNFNESVVSLGYDEDGIRTNSNSHQTYATLIQTGNLYGLAYQRALRLIFAGTYFKSYADTGPVQTSGWLQSVDPLGAVYAITPVALAGNPANNNNARVYANLNKIKDPTSADPFIAGNPAGVDPRRTGGINYDINDCNGPNGTSPQAYPATNASCWQHDPVAFDKVGTIGLGDVEADDEEKTIFVVNLADKKLYQLPVIADTNQWPIQTLAAPPVTIPNNCANPADAVPGGLGFKDGNLYVGVTCTAKSSQDTDDLKAEVWRYNPQTQAFSASPVFSLDLDFPRGCIFSGFDAGEVGQGGINAPKNNLNSINTTNCQSFNNGNSPVVIDSANWNPWPTNWQDLFTSNMGINTPGKPGHTNMGFIQIEHPSPWLSDISFDGDDLVLGFRDTNGDRMGNVVRSPNITTNTALPTVYRVQDQFGAQAYGNNNGNVNWNGSWTETGETTNPTADDIQIINNVSNYQLRLQGASNSIQRRTSSNSNVGTPPGVNSTTGTLSFAYRRVAMDSADVVTVDVSTSGVGGPFTTIATISGSGAGVTDPTYRTAIYQITLGADTVLRFSTNASMSGTNQLFLDNVEIMNATPAWMTQYTYQYTGAAFGDLLRSCWNGTSWDLESNGACGGLVTPGANNGQGPGTGSYPGTIGSPFTGYGEFYWDDSGPGSRNANSGVANDVWFDPTDPTNAYPTATKYRGHEQTMMGGIFQQAGLPDTAVTIADQFGFGDGGLSRFSNVANHPQITLQANGNLLPLRTYPAALADSNSATGNEAGLALRHTQLYNNADGFFAKANGLGDVEALLDSAPLELGNRLWCDTGVSGVGAFNGIQDPGETVAPNGITVRLTCGAEYAEVNTSGGTGSYLFTDALWNASANTTSTIIPRNATCTISVATTGANATALTSTCGGIAATVPNAQGDTSNSPVRDIRDSDATVVLTGGDITSAQIQVLTGGPGGNNHTAHHCVHRPYGPGRRQRAERPAQRRGHGR